jgi:hypothetical protein
MTGASPSSSEPSELLVLSESEAQNNKIYTTNITKDPDLDLGLRAIQSLSYARGT